MGKDEYVSNWNHGFNYGNIKPKTELLIKKKNRNFNTLHPYSVKVMMQEIQFINFVITILKSKTTFKFRYIFLSNNTN